MGTKCRKALCINGFRAFVPSENRKGNSHLSPKPGTNEKTGTNGKCRKPLIYRGLKEFVPEFVPAGEKPIGYLIFLSPLFFFFWGQIWGQNERNPESMGISGIFHLSPYFEGGDKQSEKPHFTGVFKESILSPIFLFWGQTGTKFSFLISVP